jgi:hypothetical protein
MACDQVNILVCHQVATNCVRNMKQVPDLLAISVDREPVGRFPNCQQGLLTEPTDPSLVKCRELPATVDR